MRARTQLACMCLHSIHTHRAQYNRHVDTHAHPRACAPTVSACVLKRQLVHIRSHDKVCTPMPHQPAHAPTINHVSGLAYKHGRTNNHLCCVTNYYTLEPTETHRAFCFQIMARDASRPEKQDTIQTLHPSMHPLEEQVQRPRSCGFVAEQGREQQGTRAVVSSTKTCAKNV
jgi:hypothetical protein